MPVISHRNPPLRKQPRMHQRRPTNAHSLNKEWRKREVSRTQSVSCVLAQLLRRRFEPLYLAPTSYGLAICTPQSICGQIWREASK
jgi:hypothetical protein